MASFRDERVGSVNAARLLGVTVKELKDSIQRETTLRGVIPPKVFTMSGRHRTEMIFIAGDVMDVAEELNKRKG